MKLVWHGHSCFSVVTDAGTVVLDPYEDGAVPGLPPLRLTADRVLCSHDHHDHNARGNVSLSGRDCGVAVETVPCFHDEKRGALRGTNTIHILSAEGLRIAHLGDLGHVLSGEALEKLRGVDALLLPVGGYYTVDPPTAKRIADDVGARVVIPMHYRRGSMGYDVIAELAAFTSLCDNVTEYDSDTLVLTGDTPAQTAILNCKHE